MIVDFPETLPNPLLSGYGFSDQRRFSENDVTSGPPRRELISEFMPSNVSVSWSLSLFDYQALQAFYDNDLTHGVKNFNICLPMNSFDVIHEAQFISPLSISSYNGVRVRINSTLRVIQRNEDTLAVGQSLAAILFLFRGKCSQENIFKLNQSLNLIYNRTNLVAINEIFENPPYQGIRTRDFNKLEAALKSIYG